MYEYFKMIQRTASLDDTEYNSIAELTRDLAISGGYSRDVFTFKNGNQRIRTKYSRPFDDILTAKWLLYYKKLYISKLHSHPELSEFHVQIINKTMFSVMNSYNMETMMVDNIINKYVNMSLGNRIGEVLYTIGSKTRLDEYLNRTEVKHNRLNLKTSINYMAESYEQLLENGLRPKQNCENLDNYSDIVVDIKAKLGNNKIGLELLDVMLQTDGRLDVQRMCESLHISVDTISKSDKRNIIVAYHIIKDTVIEYCESVKE